MNRDWVDVCLALPSKGARAGAVSGVAGRMESRAFLERAGELGGDIPVSISVLLMMKLRHRKLRKMPKDTLT